MSILRVTNDFLLKAKSLCQRMRSSEGTALSLADLQVIREQLRRVDAEAERLQERKISVSGPTAR
jgi:hypothetical protein